MPLKIITVYFRFPYIFSRIKIYLLRRTKKNICKHSYPKVSSISLLNPHKNFMPNGYGILRYHNYSIAYEGNFFCGLPHGYGIKYFDDGYVEYEGEFLCGKFNGNGILYDNLGNIIYDGLFYNNHIALANDPSCLLCSEFCDKIFAIDPCGHTHLCLFCLQKLQFCPLCRGPINNFLQVFI